MRITVLSSVKPVESNSGGLFAESTTPLPNESKLPGNRLHIWMKTRFHSISLLILIGALLFSTMGVTTIAATCTKGSSMKKVCPKCKHISASRTKSDGCCKVTISHSALKTEFEKLPDFKTIFSFDILNHSPYIGLVLNEDSYQTSKTSSGEHLAFSLLTSLEKCALLSTYLI
jgi:hypothetical protein